MAAEPTPGRYVTAGMDGSLQRWSAGSPSPTPIEVDGSPWALAVSPDGSLLAVAGDGGLHVLRLGVPFRVRRPDALRVRCAELGGRLLEAAGRSGGEGPPVS